MLASAGISIAQCAHFLVFAFLSVIELDEDSSGVVTGIPVSAVPNR